MVSLVRRAVDEGLLEYLNTVKFMDYDQGKEIHEALLTAVEEISDVKNELHRIGINYNQEIRLRQIEAKYRSAKSPMLLRAKERERSEVMDESQTLSKDELDAIIARFEDATRKVSEELCRILT